ncbi:MAG: hypothetical protein B6245_09070 [Desulfobacteraceae bacterium 4572_88]|nr:MAG: hypothetical protein B6245_09070 [Desulfobacteraceae bacterium 4572_88]
MKLLIKVPDYNGFREGRSPGMPDIPHKAAENTGALFFPCDLRASVRDHKKKIGGVLKLDLVIFYYSYY